MAGNVGERTDNRPVLARIAGRKDAERGALGPAFDIHIGGAFLSVGRARQYDIGPVGAGIAVMALIDDEGVAEPVHVELVGAQQPDQADLARAGAVKDSGCIAAALARRKAEIEPSDP